MDGRRQGERLLAIVAPERWDGKPRRRVGATGSGAICGRNEEEPGAPFAATLTCPHLPLQLGGRWLLG